MKTSLDKKIHLANLDPEVKSYIYQSIGEFEPYITPETLISVIAKDPMRLYSQLEAEGKEISRTELRKLHRISITLSEDGSKLEEEGVHEDIFEAIKIAKQKLLKTLAEIQDTVISNKDRAQQIYSARQNGTVH